MHDAGAARGAAMLRTAMGPEVSGALGNPHILEVTVNPDGRLWLDHAIQGRVDTGICLAPAAVERDRPPRRQPGGRASWPRPSDRERRAARHGASASRACCRR